MILYVVRRFKGLRVRVLYDERGKELPRSDNVEEIPPVKEFKGYTIKDEIAQSYIETIAALHGGYGTITKVSSEENKDEIYLLGTIKEGSIMKNIEPEVMEKILSDIDRFTGKDKIISAEDAFVFRNMICSYMPYDRSYPSAEKSIIGRLVRYK